MQKASDAHATSAEEWRRKYLTESKVNQELGRRLRDMKRKMETDRDEYENLRRELEAARADLQTLRRSKACATCSAGDTKPAPHLNENQQSLLPEVFSNGSENTQMQTMMTRRRTSSILVRRQSGKIQNLREILDNFTPSVESSASICFKNESSPLQTAPKSNDPRVEKTSDHSSSGESEEGDNQHTDTDANNPNEFADASLGNLFKYAVVLTGPMPPKPKMSMFRSISSRFKTAEFRRTYSDAPLPRKPYTILSPGSNRHKHVSPPTDSRQRSVDFVSEESQPKPVRRKSPTKKSGWLSSIVPPRFRGPHQDPMSSPITTDSKKKSPQEPVATLAAPSENETPRMLSVFPPVDSGVAELEGLLEICFPYGEQTPPLSDFSVANLRRTLQERHRTYRSPDSTFVLTIASASNPTELTYAICVHFPLFPEDEAATTMGDREDGDEMPAHGCICLLSPYPFFSFFFKLVFGIASIWESKRREYVQDHAIALKEKKMPPSPLGLSDFVKHFENIMTRLGEMPVPAMGGWTRLELAPQFTPLAFHRPHSANVAAERRHLVLEYAAPLLFALLSVDQVIFLLGCLCCERKVLVVSDHANTVSSCVLALITLLDPLRWAGPVITLLPPRLDELLEAPVPLIAGRVSIKSASIPNFSTLNKPMNGVIEMNMDQNNLCMHEEDLMSYHELKLPGCDRLVHELQPYSAKLFEHHLDADFPTIEHAQACEVICLRIHDHMEAMCALATGGTPLLEFGDDDRSTLTESEAESNESSFVSQGSRRCSEVVLNYIHRFQETQMFSVFTLQREGDDRDKDVLDDSIDSDYNEDDDEDDSDDSDSVSNRYSASTRRTPSRSDIPVDCKEEQPGSKEREDGRPSSLFPSEVITYKVSNA